MAIFSIAALGGTGLGPTAAGWVEMNSHLQWRWIQWIHLMYVQFSLTRRLEGSRSPAEFSKLSGISDL